MRNLLYRLFVRLAVSALLAPALAGPMAWSAPGMNFHGTLEAGSCSISAIDVDFGEITVADAVATTTVDTSAAPVAIPSSLDIACTGGLAGTVQVALTGSSPAFNAQALATNMPDLGVQVSSTLSGGSAGAAVMVPGTWYTVKGSAGSHPIVATLVRNPGAVLQGGDFLATGTIAVQIA